MGPRFGHPHHPLCRCNPAGVQGCLLSPAPGPRPTEANWPVLQNPILSAPWGESGPIRPAPCPKHFSGIPPVPRPEPLPIFLSQGGVASGSVPACQCTLPRGQGLLGSQGPSLLTHVALMVNKSVSLFSHELPPSPVSSSPGGGWGRARLRPVTSNQLVPAGDGTRPAWPSMAPGMAPVQHPRMHPSLGGSQLRIQTLSRMPSGHGGFSLPPESPQRLLWLSRGELWVWIALDICRWTQTPPLPLGAGAGRTPLRRGGGFPKTLTPGSTTGNRECREQRRPRKWPHGVGTPPCLSLLCWDPSPCGLAQVPAERPTWFFWPWPAAWPCVQ